MKYKEKDLLEEIEALKKENSNLYEWINLLRTSDNTGHTGVNIPLAEALHKNSARTKLLMELYSEAPSLNEIQLFKRALDIAVIITDSRIGFLHQVTEDQEEVVLTTWNDEALRFCSASAQSHYPIHQAGNWADSVREKRPIVYNDYYSSPNHTITMYQNTSPTSSFSSFLAY